MSTKKASRARKLSAQADRTVERVLDPQFSRHYCNTVQIESTPVDFRFRFGVVEEASPSKVVVREVSQVWMSPQHVLSFAATLKNAVEKYTAQLSKGAAEGQEGEK